MTSRISLPNAQANAGFQLRGPRVPGIWPLEVVEGVVARGKLTCQINGTWKELGEVVVFKVVSGPDKGDVTSHLMLVSAAPQPRQTQILILGCHRGLTGVFFCLLDLKGKKTQGMVGWSKPMGSHFGW